MLHAIYFDPLRKAETYTRDLRQCIGRKAAIQPDLVFLALDKSSVQLDTLFPEEIEASPALRLMKAGFPWSREVYALLAERLLAAGARVVVLDLLFPGSGPGDERFRAVLETHPEGVLLGCDFVAETGGRGMAWRIDLPAETILERRRPLDERLGYVTFWSDPDGAVRRVRMRTSLEELSQAPQPAREHFESLSAKILRRLNRADAIPESGAHLFRFAGPPRTFLSHSLYEIFVPELWERNFGAGEFFKDKVVFIGPEGGWSHDEHATPFRIIDGEGALMAGPEIHLNAVNAALQGEFLFEPSQREEIATLLLALVVGVLLSLPRGIMARLLLLAAAVVIYGEICFLLYNAKGSLLLFVLPLAVVVTTVGINLVTDYRREQKEKREIRSTLGHYVGQDVVEEILQNPAAYLHSLAGVRREVTVLFSDLRDFTGMTTRRPAKELIAQLNEYFSVMTAAVVAENGTVDKLVGDGLMAVWGNLRTKGTAADAQAAMRAALAMRAGLAELNAKWHARGWPQWRFGIGLDHGEATIGNIGSELKMDFTAIGNAVNAAARIERLTVELGHDIVIGEAVAAFATDFVTTPAGFVEVKGIARPLSVYLLEGTLEDGPALRPPPSLPEPAAERAGASAA